MASALQVTIFSACLFVLFAVASSAVSPILQQQLLQAEDKATQGKPTEEPWAPATQPREFSYNIADNIRGANQIRHEAWNNGTASGMYAYPLGANEWQIVNYVADQKGFRVISSQKVSESELMGGHGLPAKDSANVDIDRDGQKTNYTVKANEIGQRQNQTLLQQQQQQQQKESTESIEARRNNKFKNANATSSFKQQKEEEDQ